MKLGATSDSPSWSDVSSLGSELRGLAAQLERDFPETDVKFVVCLRVLPSNLHRQSFRRWYQANRVLALDIRIDEELLSPLKRDRDAQRRIIGPIFLEYFRETIDRYRKKIPELEPIATSLVRDVEKWCVAHGWAHSHDRHRQH